VAYFSGESRETRGGRKGKEERGREEAKGEGESN